MLLNSQLTAEINLTALIHNYNLLKQLAYPSKVIPILKADAYGHGAIPIAKALNQVGIPQIGVATLGEALELRQAGIITPISCWLHGKNTDFITGIKQRIILGINSVTELKRVISAGQNISLPPIIDIKIDTGLQRNGVSETEWEEFRDLLIPAVKKKLVYLNSVFSHFSHADIKNHPQNALQVTRLNSVATQLNNTGITNLKKHIANSAAILTKLDYSFDYVRPGIALYGYSPVTETNNFGLKPILRLSSEIVQIKKISAHTGVSYSHIWNSSKSGYIALVASGYADGINRNLSNNLTVTINGVAYPSVGQICMDQLLVDLGDNHHQVKPGDRAVFWDTTPGHPNAASWAKQLKTISYELLCHIGKRTERIYFYSEKLP